MLRRATPLQLLQFVQLLVKSGGNVLGPASVLTLTVSLQTDKTWEFLQRRKSPNPSEHRPTKSGFLPKMLRLRTEVVNAVMRQLRPVWLRWKLRRGFTRVCNVVARFPKVVSVKHSWLTLLCWPCIQACKISTVLGNPSSLLRMSWCYATLSAVRQSATKPPVSGPFKPTSGLTTDWPGASVPPFVSNTLMRAVKLSKFTPVALRHEQ